MTPTLLSSNFPLFQCYPLDLIKKVGNPCQSFSFSMWDMQISNGDTQKAFLESGFGRNNQEAKFKKVIKWKPYFQRCPDHNWWNLITNNSQINGPHGWNGKIVNTSNERILAIQSKSLTISIIGGWVGMVNYWGGVGGLSKWAQD